MNQGSWIPFADTAPSWLVLFILANFELHLMARFVAMKISAYAPRLVEQALIRGKLRRRESALFPSYMFLREDGAFNSNNVLAERGVVRFLECNGCFARLEDEIISGLRALESPDGLIHAAPVKVLTPRQLKFRQRVKVVDGPLTGNVGVYQGMNGRDRCSLLINFLGSKRVVSVAAQSLAAA